ncbi:MAG: signal recognition particle-docking protein FtsY, partial [bacterium]|nr:signal recognition particle-docking protein FtsY [bacterium]
VLAKLLLEAPHETLLIMDATTGQNGLNQARQFSQAVGVTGIVLTKLDGTARGGIVFSIVKELGIPVKFIGIGEKLEDIEAFNANDFVEALFA